MKEKWYRVDAVGKISIGARVWAKTEEEAKDIVHQEFEKWNSVYVDDPCGWHEEDDEVFENGHVDCQIELSKHETKSELLDGQDDEDEDDA